MIWVIPLKDKKGTTVTNDFQKIFHESNLKPSKIWVDKGSEFYNRSMKSFLQNNNIEMCLMHNEGKSDKYITSISEKVYTDKLDDIVNNKTIHIIKELKCWKICWCNSKHVYWL